MSERASIPITRPEFGPEELAAIQEPLRSGWVVQGPAVRAFEDKFSVFVGAPHCVATSSCTTALHLAVASLGLGPGDEVVVPAFTWVATANVIEYMGARPRFCDIDLASFNATADDMANATTPATIGLLPVHLFGLTAEMDPIIGFAIERGLWVVEDAACAFGATYRGRHAGTMGVMGCFSFHPRKSITTGEGGMVVTSDDHLDRVLRSLRDHGASRSDLVRHQSRAAYLLADYDRLGYNYRMTDIQGALGGAQMDRAQWILEQRRRVADSYRELLGGREWLRLPTSPEHMTHGYQAYVCLFAPEEPTLANVGRLHAARNQVMDNLEANQISTRPGTHSAALQQFYANRYGHRPTDFPNAFLADQLSMALPLYPSMTDDEISFVAAAVDRAFDRVWHT